MRAQIVLAALTAVTLTVQNYIICRGFRVGFTQCIRRIKQCVGLAFSGAQTPGPKLEYSEVAQLCKKEKWTKIYLTVTPYAINLIRFVVYDTEREGIWETCQRSFVYKKLFNPCRVGRFPASSSFFFFFGFHVGLSLCSWTLFTHAAEELFITASKHFHCGTICISLFNIFVFLIARCKL